MFVLTRFCCIMSPGVRINEIYNLSEESYNRSGAQIDNCINECNPA